MSLIFEEDEDLPESEETLIAMVEQMKQDLAKQKEKGRKIGIEQKHDKMEEDEIQAGVEEIRIPFKPSVLLPKMLVKIGREDQYIHEWCLADTGAQQNIISAEEVKRIFGSWRKAKPFIEAEQRFFRAVNGTSCKSMGKISLSLKFKQRAYKSEFSIVPDMPLKIIVGGPFFKAHRAKIDYGEEKLFLEQEHTYDMMVAEETLLENMFRSHATIVSEKDFVITKNELQSMGTDHSKRPARGAGSSVWNNEITFQTN